MKAAISLAFIVVCAFPLHAQISVALNRFQARSSEIEIRNNSPVSLAAIAVSMSPTAADRAPFTVFIDTVVDQTTMSIPPDLTYKIPVPTRRGPGQRQEDLFEPPIVTAGVFADGTTTGDAALLARLILRRCNMLQAVELARAILSEAGNRNVPRRQLIDQFQQIADSVNHWYLPQEQQVGRTLYQSIVGKLMNLPELQVGSPFPPTAFVSPETALLDRWRTTLLESLPSLSLADAAPIRR